MGLEIAAKKTIFVAVVKSWSESEKMQGAMQESSEAAGGKMRVSSPGYLKLGGRCLWCCCVSASPLPYVPIRGIFVSFHVDFN